MKQNANKDAAFLRVPLFFCPHCHANQDAVDPGDVYPICSVCRKRLEIRWSDAPRIVAPIDERPPEAVPVVQDTFQQRRKRSPKVVALESLTLLVTDFEAGIENEDLYHGLLHGFFNRFTRELIHQMILGRQPWRRALGDLSKDFCVRYASRLEEFQRWAENPAVSAVPAFIEPEPTTHHEPLNSDSPPGTSTESPPET